MSSAGLASPPPWGQPAGSGPQKAHGNGTSAYSGPFLPPTTHPLQNTLTEEQVWGAEVKKTPAGELGPQTASAGHKPLLRRRPGGPQLACRPEIQTQPGWAEPSLLSSSKECSRKETPVLCPLRRSLETPHRVGVCSHLWNSSAKSEAGDMGRIKEGASVCTFRKEGGFLPSLDPGPRALETSTSTLRFVRSAFLVSNPSAAKISHLTPKVQSKVSPTVLCKYRSPVLAQAAGAFLPRLSLDPTAIGTGAAR